MIHRRKLVKLATKRRVGVVVGLLAVAGLIQATVVLAGAPQRPAPAVNSTALPNALQGAHGRVLVGQSYKNDVSATLRSTPAMPLKPMPEREAAANPHVGRHVNAKDTVVQQSLAAPNMPPPTHNFDGIPFPGVGCNCAPPDTNGEVGATQYVQIVNEGFQVFDKSTGASVYGPAAITTLWSGFGGVCQNAGDGDPVVLYDQLANRWVITQFAGSSVPTDECIAVSTTSDATGSWYRYGFHLGSNFFDYPKLAVWPDAYYMSMNVFNSSGTAFLGPQPFAFNRSAMLSGSAASFVTTGVTGGSSEEAYLPADLDGSTPPPAGAPETFVEWPNAGAYRIYHFHVDWATPANSSFTLFAAPAAAGFTQLCPVTRACVPEPNGGEPRRDRRPLHVPGRLPQLRRPRVARDELHGQLRRCRRDSLARAPQRHLRAGHRLPAEHLPARLDLALDGQRGHGPHGRPRARLQRVELGDRPAASLRGAARERSRSTSSRRARRRCSPAPAARPAPATAGATTAT